MPSLLEAIEHKYGRSASEELLIANGGGKNVKQSEKGDKEDDERGASTISVAIFVPRRPPRACVPSLLVLNNCGIATAGRARDLRELADKCALVEELDLATNCLSRWEDALAILGAMPRLRFVNLSFNRLGGGNMTALAAPAPEPAPRWERLSSLVLNATGAEWPCVEWLLTAAPQLEELHLSLNGYDGVQLAEDYEHGPSLKRLHFTGNPVRSWREVRRLGRAFPKLECLVLADCPLDDPMEGDEQDFTCLRVLNLDGTQLNSWVGIEKLATFPQLTSVRVRGCRLWEGRAYTEHERRQLLIARLPAVRMLNGGGPIEPQEREDAERAFIRRYMERPESDRPARYTELVAVHGKLDPLVDIDLRPEKRVRVRFTYGDTSEVRSVDVYRTVSDLKLRLENFAGIPAARMRLFYVDQDMRDIQGPEEMKYPHKQLYSYNIQSGDEIIIDSKQRLSSTSSSAASSPRHH